MSRPSPAPAIMLVFAAVAACATGAPASSGAHGTAAELEALYQARQDSARMRFTDADVRFMTDMIAHHGQALLMARFAATNDASAPIRTLAARITNGQEDEIRLMQQWLRTRGQPVPEVHIEGTTLMLHGAGGHHHHMPGMLSDAQLRELAAARGPDFDRLFLTRMIEHHQGAVAMVSELFATDGAAQDAAVFRFASDVHVDQQTEIARMERMLSAMTQRATP